MKRIPLLAAVIAVVAAGVLSVALTAPASASSVAFYPIQNSATGMCLQPAGGFVDDGTAIVQGHCDGSAAQNWEVVSLGGNSYQFRNQLSLR